METFRHPIEEVVRDLQESAGLTYEEARALMGPEYGETPLDLSKELKISLHKVQTLQRRAREKMYDFFLEPDGEWKDCDLLTDDDL